MCVFSNISTAEPNMSIVTYQQARRHRNDVSDSVLSAGMLGGLGNVAEDVAVENSSKDEVDMTDQNKSQALFHQPPWTFILIWMTEKNPEWFL